MPGRSWTEAEDEVLRKDYGKKKAYEIGDALGRSFRAVHQRARLLGLHRLQDKALIAERKNQIRELLKLGYSDGDMAEKIGMDRREVSRFRTNMGLPPSGRNERYRQKVRRNTAKQLKDAGVNNLAELRSKKMAEFAASIGWPGLSLRGAQIAEALYRLGPMTQKQICAAIGKPWTGPKKSLKNRHVPGHSYMAELQRAGIVVRLESAITHKGKGNHEDLYMIGLEVEPCQKTS